MKIVLGYAGVGKKFTASILKRAVNLDTRKDDLLRLKYRVKQIKNLGAIDYLFLDLNHKNLEALLSLNYKFYIVVPNEQSKAYYIRKYKQELMPEPELQDKIENFKTQIKIGELEVPKERRLEISGNQIITDVLHLIT